MSRNTREGVLVNRIILNFGELQMNLKPIASNMTELEVKGAHVLFSYSTPVACSSVGKYYKTEKKWSNTTTRHINKWLDGVNAEVVPQEFFDNLLKGI